MKLKHRTLPEVGRISIASLLLFGAASLLSTASHAGNPIGTLLDKCRDQQHRAEKSANDQCLRMHMNPNNPLARKCVKDATAKGEAAFNACMNADSHGACVAKEYQADRSGCQGGVDRGCALMKCGYTYQDLEAMGLYDGWGSGGGGKCAGYKLTCPGAPAQASAHAAAAPTTNVGGNCKVSSSFQSAGWHCRDLKGQEAGLNEAGVPAAEQLCTSSQIDALIRQNNDGICSNLINQREAVRRKYASAKEAALKRATGGDMGSCKASPNFRSAGWHCKDIKGQTAGLTQAGVPADKQLCTAAQLDALVAAGNDGLCSNLIEQREALRHQYVNAKADAEKKAAADKAAALQAQQAAAAKAAAAKAEAAKAAAAKTAAAKAAAEKAAAGKVQMGSCKPSPNFQSRGWHCKDIKGQTAGLNQAGVPANEQLCDAAQIDALIAIGNDSVCSNLIEQREALRHAYVNGTAQKAAAARAAAAKLAAEKAAAARLAAEKAAAARAALGKCVPSSKFSSRGWRCSDLPGQLGQYDKYKVPAGER
ncbi:MAG: hypothetical protein KGL53_01805, partial [Elusimicrobia bacterium]|nr:hypothetical protein [Elusimicrobiota bacterium]